MEFRSHRAAALRSTGDTHPGLGGGEPHPAVSVEITQEPGQAAMDAGTRAEASLSALQRAMSDVTVGLNEARDANEQLTRELQRTRMLLNASEGRRNVLEAELADTRAQAAADRTFLLEEQDRFLAALLEEHEAELSARTTPGGPSDGRAPVDASRTAETAAPPPRPEKRTEDPGMAAKLRKLEQERDRGREVLRRLQRQRDEAQTEVERLREALDQARAEFTSGQSDGSDLARDPHRTQPALPRSESHRPPAPPTAEPAPTPPRPTAPAAAAPRSRTISSRPPLAKKPDPVSRPLGGYSMGADDLSNDAIPRTSKSSRS